MTSYKQCVIWLGRLSMWRWLRAHCMITMWRFSTENPESGWPKTMFFFPIRMGTMVTFKLMRHFCGSNCTRKNFYPQMSEVIHISMCSQILARCPDAIWAQIWWQRKFQTIMPDMIKALLLHTKKKPVSFIANHRIQVIIQHLTLNWPHKQHVAVVETPLFSHRTCRKQAKNFSESGKVR